MKGIQISSYVKSVDELVVSSSLPAPVPSPNEYLISIHATALNFFDILQVQGRYQHQPPFPWTAGSEFAGIVVGIPTHPSHNAPRQFKLGDRVFGAMQGAFAELVACPPESLLPVPEGWDFVEAAGLYVTAPTAYGALITRANLQRGEWCLVHAAAGGVSLSAIQIAKSLGATVVATASSKEKLNIAAQFGADHLVNYTDPNWPSQVAAICKSHSHPQGIDVVFDPVGLINPSLKVAAWNARLLVVGFAGGEIEKVAVNRVLLKNVSVVGIHWGMYARFEPETVPKVWGALFELIREGKFRPTVFRGREWVGLEGVKDGLKALESRETWGKVVVKVPAGGEKGSRL
ncbi:hypothetical protein BDZ91DRAFT_777820 [Kalaharituber pfeilii]|nr:hypothetical protein BDZ91DRAFT_777820 [Kalaharituber pfeilii]